MPDETRNVQGLDLFDFMRPQTLDEIEYQRCDCQDQRVFTTGIIDNHLIILPVPKIGLSLEKAVSQLFTKSDHGKMTCNSCNKEFSFKKTTKVCVFIFFKVHSVITY